MSETINERPDRIIEQSEPPPRQTGSWEGSQTYIEVAEWLSAHRGEWYEVDLLRDGEELILRETEQYRARGAALKYHLATRFGVDDVDVVTRRIDRSSPVRIWAIVKKVKVKAG